MRSEIDKHQHYLQLIPALISFVIIWPVSYFPSDTITEWGQVKAKDGNEAKEVSSSHILRLTPTDTNPVISLCILSQPSNYSPIFEKIFYKNVEALNFNFKIIDFF